MKEWSLAQNKKCWTVTLNVNEEVHKAFDHFTRTRVTDVVGDAMNEVLRVANTIKSALV